MKLKDKLLQLHVTTLKVPNSKIVIVVAFVPDSDYVSVKHSIEEFPSTVNVKRVNENAVNDYAAYLMDNGHIEPLTDVSDCPFRDNYIRKPVLLITGNGTSCLCTIESIVPHLMDLSGVTNYWEIARTIKQNALVGKNIFVYTSAYRSPFCNTGIVFIDTPVRTSFNAKQMKSEINIHALSAAANALREQGKCIRDYAVVFCTDEQYNIIVKTKLDVTTLVSASDMDKYLETMPEKDYSVKVVNDLVFKVEK